MLFQYKAKIRTGEIIEGTINAPNENVAVDVLHGKDYVIVSIHPVEKGGLNLDIGKYLQRPKNKDIVAFTRQLSVLIDADVPLNESLRTLAAQEEKTSFKKVITDVSEAIEGGSSLSIALSLYPQLFSGFYIMLVQSGEVSGRLHQSLLYLANYLERTQGINSKIKGALAYPAFVLFSLVLVAIIMTVYVLPNLLSIFEEFGAVELPLTTRILIFVTDNVNKYKIPFAIFIVGAGFFGYSYIKTEAGRNYLDKLKISIPSLGSVARNLYLARIAESLSTLIKSGIPILDSLKLTGDLVGNVIYRDIIAQASENVRSGGNISDAISKHPKEIPSLFASMMSVGERTGKLDYILEHIAKFYKSESEDSIQNISQLIEPILVLLLGFGVAILVSSILLPIYNIVGFG
ncbi:MAG: hypothetical protein A3B99_03040 [Candidatus Yanofskybacteria bacterium RIFCSPHIGHO2_02_FULL_44_12b]|uniref:Type II secretion system protein GspF domain-containing protein n=2 Tax=Candidatus Yanofskyibacteriota TaxID=1752733 RepID=A0A1F8GNG1_9BACT|nr:MAG: Type II secretion system F domain protein [Candidatus Yanofskybacteria bacterium GW2011_GWA2_44_9]OGN05500.1 MAG: hypothetical protein A2659_02815 [Candidatus Yanofskybacteria bacterium RIFCSPHIGHO2_01_FULL_44_24]OGN15051.1 MAG: hypothetical protein A3B99_03040 [Candidatus Yanofskybacteria bacterium RIFCSPHIGHO2_02_FULL_44_12b]OGN26520.1 MAG: hypothetical protein A2925_03185 [Candidatus Yanofskybacteria bacterium RIFCSPLOWO2_01_FULL_44_22]